MSLYCSYLGITGFSYDVKGKQFTEFSGIKRVGENII